MPGAGSMLPPSLAEVVSVYTRTNVTLAVRSADIVSTQVVALPLQSPPHDATA